jgi:hypothetical protein
MITIPKSELEKLEESLKEKDLQIRKLQIDNTILIGLNHHNAILLMKSVVESVKLIMDLYYSTPIPEEYPEIQKIRDTNVASLEKEIAGHKERMDGAIVNARTFCLEHADIVRLIRQKYRIDLVALTRGDGP